MESRPRLKLEITSTDKILEVSGWFTLIFLWVLTIVFYEMLPDIIPTHFDGSGNANSYGSKMTIMFLPPIATVLFIGLTLLNNYPHIFNYPVSITPDNAFKQYTNATRMLRSLKLMIAFIFSLVVVLIYYSVQSGSGSLSTWFLPLILLIIFVPTTFFVIKAVKGR